MVRKTRMTLAGCLSNTSLFETHNIGDTTELLRTQLLSHEGNEALEAIRDADDLFSSNLGGQPAAAHPSSPHDDDAPTDTAVQRRGAKKDSTGQSKTDVLSPRKTRNQRKKESQKTKT